MFPRLALPVLATSLFAIVDAQFNNPPGVDIWCGKAYRDTNASFNPGGWFEEPAKSATPLVDFKVKPRMNLYLADDTSSTLVVDASISWYIGHALPGINTSTLATHNSAITLQITIGDTSLLTNKTSIALGSTRNEIPFDLSILPVSSEPHNVTVVGTLQGHKNATFTASTQLTKLPLRSDNGTVTRLDNLYGGLSVRKGQSKEWTSLFPYTYYVQWSLYWYANLSTLDEFAAMGYNVIHIVPTGDLGDTSFPWEEFQPYLDRADELGLYFMYDVRWDYANLTTMVDQIHHLHNHPSILLWYTADEPDGKSNPINSTLIAYDTIKAIDPYHPVSLALNCRDFYYSDYAAGAEIVLEDVYPISTNTSYSEVYNTPCNATYGCCGCDDCEGSFHDISTRLDEYTAKDNFLGWQKIHWAAPQAFGNETFWTRYPTAAEEVVMNMLSINHAAKGIVMWDFPTKADILDVTNRLAAVLTKEPVADFLVGAPLLQELKVVGAGNVDAAAWVKEDEVLISIVNLDYGNTASNVTVILPGEVEVTKVSKSFWGDTSWSTHGNRLTVSSLMGLEVSLLLLKRC
ncbi:hypothetical protein AUEXF2481DRAFT_69850 [Aureobasidium subglaciale EXF-2481]|uniref:Glycoside hydrolase family 2 catalytic domain-containing protein n=1 Tax=Aureobasidium subglaciale (strain EXF-2481) TaxID=1043005 RepID=A0A074Y688_AURSE|nr:uncharacterized protein AUEXF2481DRAFT_69850 [Aureobasidium subglaciale EXF-2481]KEQ91479.1 hypothetical protein AUEXF2481DRAFT_69850 [Aureobasidium subglaciale EXF-2481]